jgi:hypothetical protein
MTKRFADTIPESLNLVVNMAFGLRAGHAAEEVGTHKAAQSMFIEVNQETGN